MSPFGSLSLLYFTRLMLFTKLAFAFLGSDRTNRINSLPLFLTHGKGARKHFVRFTHSLKLFKKLILNIFASFRTRTVECTQVSNSSLFTLRSSFSWCKDTTSAQGHLSKCVVECRSLVQPNDALLYTLMMRIISTYKSASLAPNDAHHESSLKHIFNRACRFAVGEIHHRQDTASISCF